MSNTKAKATLSNRASKAMNNPKNIEEAVLVCTPYVNKLAHKWKRNHFNEFCDLQQAGFVGVCEAWNRFDSEKSVKFTTYAWWWIRAYIREYAMKKWEYNNNTTAEKDNNDSYNINTDFIQLSRSVEKLSEDDQKLYMMRLDGFTFQQIADETGADSLHKVRNRLEALNAELG